MNVSMPIAAVLLDLGFQAKLVKSIPILARTASLQALLTDAAAARIKLGLGSMAAQNSGAVAITGGSVDGLTLDGGTF